MSGRYTVANILFGQQTVRNVRVAAAEILGPDTPAEMVLGRNTANNGWAAIVGPKAASGKLWRN